MGKPRFRAIVDLMMAHPDDKKVAHNALRDALHTMMAVQLNESNLFLIEIGKMDSEIKLTKMVETVQIECSAPRDGPRGLKSVSL